MKYSIHTWNIKKLIAEYEGDRLNLNPPYQRKFIWSEDDQRTLVDSVLNNIPIPNIFLFQRTATKLEMVDGQQRTRAILAFYNRDISTFDDIEFDEEDHKHFLSYKFPIVVIEELEDGDISIEDFYALVNNTGVHLNRPELKKAEFYTTKFLKLINECAQDKGFKSLSLFTDATVKRMNDIDFVSELLTLLEKGITDKKEKVDDMFEEDVDANKYKSLLAEFKRVIALIVGLNEVYTIKKTRYKQRNDFYTLFGFIHQYENLDQAQLKYIYQILVLVGDDIFPSNEECPPFQNYARNCVTQSNSKSARTDRLNFLEQFFLNVNSAPNLVQKEILKYYELLDSELKEIEGYYTVDIGRLKAIKSNIVFNG